ncbi:MAG TPA: PilZ domain-containing protein [Anaeromyxobacter sp.]|nr:PilZ domain-containing protein [Anaeromyxobacter sp.]
MTADGTDTRQVAREAELAFLFGALHRRALDALRFVEALPALCEGALVECDLGANASYHHFACVARLVEPVGERTARRLEFWAWRLGATLCHGSRAGRTALRACTVVQRQVRPEHLASALREPLGLLGTGPSDGCGRLAVRLALGRPEEAGLAFEARERALFVPSPRQPPLGDELALEVQLTSSEVVSAGGVVRKTRAAGEGGPGSPAGFVVELVAPDEALVRALERGVRPTTEPEQRRAPRYPVQAIATIAACNEPPAGRPPERLDAFARGAPGDGDAWIENLSQGGAFVRTSAAMAAGTKVRLELELPGGGHGAAPGTVVHSSARGMGIRFDGDPATDAQIGAVLEQVAGRQRRALVVDDDLLSRTMLGDALAAKGFETYFAADGTNGLRALIDLLLDLHLLVVDLHMPGLDGEKLIRTVREAGGERDLTIVVMSGAVNPERQQHLLAVGADAVLEKSEGMATIAEAAVRTLLRRERSRRRRARALERLA